MKQKVFISSVQGEFAEERHLLADYFRNDSLMHLFFDPFIFEEVPATDNNPEKVYLSEVKESDIYIALLGENYGHEDVQGVSPTEHEYNTAKEFNLQRWIFIKDVERRNNKEKVFINKIESDVSRKIFTNWEKLKKEVYNSCILFLKQNGFIDTHDFDSSLNRDASLGDIDNVLLHDFIRVARAKRNFPMKETDSVEKVLTSLKMLRNGQLVNSALLAFCRVPQKFFPTATVKCAHFHGLKIEKPIPDYKEFGGTVFDMSQQAVDFVLSKISLSTGARDVSNRVDTEYEIPRRVVAEAIINAIAHRDYLSNSSIQIYVFKNRIEIVNPGKLPVELSIEDLKKPHNSYPHNPILAECLFLTGDIERFGTGTLDLFELSSLQRLPEPLFLTDQGVRLTIWRTISLAVKSTDHYTDHYTDHDTDYDTDHDASLIERLILIMDSELSRKEMMLSLDLKHSKNFRDNYLSPAEDKGYIQMTIPDKPRSKFQKYKLTRKGNILHNKLIKLRN